MTRRVVLQKPQRFGDLAVCAVVEHEVQVWAMASVAGGSATLRPLAILIADPTGLRGWHPDGTSMAPGAIDALCPGAADAMTAALSDGTGQTDGPDSKS